MTSSAAGRTAFIHIDMDNLWAVADCYGARIDPADENLIYEDALPRFLDLVKQFDFRATLFIVGRDLERQENAIAVRDAVAAGHAAANHSYTHRLDFRALDDEQLQSEIMPAHEALQSKAGASPMGFRAPGYGISPALIGQLQKLGYRYDSSISPHPFGGAFRFLDARIRRRFGDFAVPAKTQYSRFRETWSGLQPYEISSTQSEAAHGPRLMEFPVAVSPMRLPFQAGVCMKLGKRYFDHQLRSFLRKPALPLLFLFHGIDLADLTPVRHPLFRSPMFSMPIVRKLELAKYFLARISEHYSVAVTEEWVQNPTPVGSL